MKANEAPEKIYINSNFEKRTWLIGKGDSSFIEYVRTDAFIEKACELLVNCIEDFMARRMEIWDEECKNQTLENLRNTLKK